MEYAVVMIFDTAHDGRLEASLVSIRGDMVSSLIGLGLKEVLMGLAEFACK
jgi:hypothetical protein